MKVIRRRRRFRPSPIRKAAFIADKKRVDSIPCPESHRYRQASLRGDMWRRAEPAVGVAELIGIGGSLEELDRFGMGVDAVGEEDGMDLLAAVDGDQQLGSTGGQRARFAQIHYLVADLANPQHLASNT